MKVIVKEVSNKGELKSFYQFPNKLYKKCKVYVPSLDRDQLTTLTKDPALNYCKRRLWLAYNESGKVVGRIQGVINPHYNDYYEKKCIRFGWFDFENDIDIADALLNEVSKWGAQEGMEKIHGPLFYNTLGKQGMLIEGFDKIPPFNCLYNFEYYPQFMNQLGFEKECDWIQYEMNASQGPPPKLKRISEILLKRYNLREVDLSEIRKDKRLLEDLKSKFFKMYNESFKSVYNFIPLTPEEEKKAGDEYFRLLRRKLTCIILDQENDIAAFGISLPSFSRALIRTRGKLFPFGWFFILMAYIRFNTVDLLLLGASPKWESKGLSAVFHYKLASYFKKKRLKAAISNPQIENNNAIKVWESYEHKLFMRRRCWIKEIKEITEKTENKEKTEIK